MEDIAGWNWKPKKANRHIADIKAERDFSRKKNGDGGKAVEM